MKIHLPAILLVNSSDSAFSNPAIGAKRRFLCVATWQAPQRVAGPGFQLADRNVQYIDIIYLCIYICLYYTKIDASLGEIVHG